MAFFNSFDEGSEMQRAGMSPGARAGVEKLEKGISNLWSDITTPKIKNDQGEWVPVSQPTAESSNEAVVAPEVTPIQEDIAPDATTPNMQSESDATMPIQQKPVSQQRAETVIAKNAIPPSLIESYNETVNGKVYSGTELLDFSDKISKGGKAWISVKNPKTGESKMFLKDEGGFTTAKDLAKSLDIYGQIIESRSGKGAAVALTEALTNNLKPAGSPPDPINNKDEVTRAIFRGMIKEGLISLEEGESIYDPEQVDVGTPFDINQFAKYIKGGANLRSQGESKINVLAATMGHLTTDPLFEKLVPKQKAFIVNKVYDATMGAIQSEDQQNIMKAVQDEHTARVTMIDRLTADASNDMIYVQASPEQIDAATKEIQANQIGISKIDGELNTAHSKMTKIANVTVESLENIGVNAKALEEEIRTGKDTSAIMAEQLRTIDDPELRQKATEYYDAFRATKDQIALGLDQRKIYEGAIAKAQGIRLKGVPINGNAFRDAAATKTVAEMNSILTHPDQKQYSEFWDSATVGGTDDTARMGTMLLNYSFERQMNEAKTDGVKIALQQEKSKYQAALLDGTIMDLPGGQQIVQGLQEAKARQSRVSSNELIAARSDKYDKFKSKFESDFYKKMVESDDPAALLEESKPYLDPSDYTSYVDFLKAPPLSFDNVIADPKTSKSMKKAAIVELEKESASVATTVAESLKFIRGGSRNTKAGLITSADDAITSVVNSGLKNEHKAALIGLLARNNEVSGVARGDFVDGYGFDKLFEMHTTVAKATGAYGGWTEFMDMYSALDKKLAGVSKDVTKEQKTEIVNTFIKEAVDPLMNRMRTASVARLTTGR